MKLDVTIKAEINVSGESLDDLIDSLSTIRDRAAGSDVTVDYNSYELVLEWTETL